MKSDKKILICFNEPVRYYENYTGKHSLEITNYIDSSEKNVVEQIENIRSILNKKYTSVEVLSVNKDIKNFIDKLRAISPDFVFNLVESVEGNANFESYIAGVYELLEISYTGNTPLCLGNCLNKSRTKQILLSDGILTPKFIVVELNSYPRREDFSLKFPVITKLAREDASIGISENSLVRNFTELYEQLEYLFRTYKQEILIEEYIEGREINVAILDTLILPLSEIKFDSLPENLPKIITYEAKWSPESIYYNHTVPECPAKLPKDVEEKIKRTAQAAYNALDCRDYARIDIRLSKRNVPYVIEVNPNPDISPDAGFIRSANAAGLSFEDIILTIAELAEKRIRYDTQAAI
ncbi:D-alanine--D-alanine ligase family protein [Melioribacter sp. OK-6-Me]|uniref:D-alanine--D-alanine ligase family protein n=1 Tax=unclassified Melioribacter TaxID=2627329 RepID=UPI003ED8488A